MSARHTPARQCAACEGFCLRAASIDDALTAIAVSRSAQERVPAYEALIAAAQEALERNRAQAAAQASTNTQAQAPQHVLKAEAATPDATDRGAPVITSPDGGPTGAGQPAAAGPTDGEHAAPSPLEALQALHYLCSIALASPDGRQFAYLETRAKSFVHMADVMRNAEAAIASAYRSAA